MLILKQRAAYVSVQDGKQVIFHRLAPALGGVSTGMLLDALGIPHGEVGDWVLRTVDYTTTVQLLEQLAGADLRRRAGGAELQKVIESLMALLLDVEKL